VNRRFLKGSGTCVISGKAKNLKSEIPCCFWLLEITDRRRPLSVSERLQILKRLPTSVGNSDNDPSCSTYPEIRQEYSNIIETVAELF
jgi:hypothetical protein